tara:strand:- start:150 stop:1766 length:1617 start_codon:yes stop_codon:yes gene_type:complete
MAIQLVSNQIIDSIVTTDKLGANVVTPAKVDLSQVFNFTALPTVNSDPSSANDLVRKNYVDNLISGLHWKDSCRVKSPSNIDISDAPATIDGITMASGDRVLLSAQTTSSEMGIYDYNGQGAAMTRSDDADVFQELNGIAVFIREGTSANEGYTQTSELTDFSGQVYALFTSTAGGRQAGTALSLSSNTLNVDFDNATIGVNGSDALEIKANGIGTALIQNSAVTNAKLQNDSVTISSGSGLQGGGAVALGGSATLSILANGSSLSVSGSGIKIADDGVQTQHIGDAQITSALIADGSVILDKLANLSSAQILLGNASNRPAAVSVSGDIAISNAGVTAIQALAVQTGMVADSAITNSKLASSALSVTAGNGLSGGGSISLGSSGALAVQADGSTISVSASGVKVADGQIGAAQITNGSVGSDELASNSVLAAKISTGAVTASKVADDSLGLVKLSMRPNTEAFNGTSATKYDLGQTVLAAFHKGVQVYRNGLRLEFVASSPSGPDQYTVANDGTGGVTAITLGAASSGSRFIVDYLH